MDDDDATEYGTLEFEYFLLDDEAYTCMKLMVPLHMKTCNPVLDLGKKSLCKYSKEILILKLMLC